MCCLQMYGPARQGVALSYRVLCCLRGSVWGLCACRACRIKNQPLPNKQLLLEEDLLPLLPANSSTGSMSVTQMQVGGTRLAFEQGVWLKCQLQTVR